MAQVNPVQDDQLEFPYYFDENGKVLIWDDPTMVGGIRHPNYYKPDTHYTGVLEKYERGIYNLEEITILKVLGDAICCNEDQLRRYLSVKYSRSFVSDRLKRMRRFGLADRWYVHSTQYPDDRLPPAPFSLGISGYLFLKSHYHEQFFMHPEKWLEQGLRTVQRYVALNEIRCQFAENHVLRNWIWNGIIDNNPRLTRPHAVCEIETTKGRLNLIIDRAQQGRDFVSFFRKKLPNWEKVYKRHGTFPIRGAALNKAVVVYYCSTKSMAAELFKELRHELKEVTFPVWFCIEENLYKPEGLYRSFYVASDKLLPFNLKTYL